METLRGLIEAFYNACWLIKRRNDRDRYLVLRDPAEVRVAVVPVENAGDGMIDWAFTNI